MKYAILILMVLFFGFTPFAPLPIAPDAITAKGGLLTHDGSGIVEFPACADGEIIEWDSTQTVGFKCITTPTGGGTPPGPTGLWTEFAFGALTDVYDVTTTTNTEDSIEKIGGSTNTFDSMIYTTDPVITAGNGYAEFEFPNPIPLGSNNRICFGLSGATRTPTSWTGGANDSAYVFGTMDWGICFAASAVYPILNGVLQGSTSIFQGNGYKFKIEIQGTNVALLRDTGSGYVVECTFGFAPCGSGGSVNPADYPYKVHVSSRNIGDKIINIFYEDLQGEIWIQ